MEDKLNQLLDDGDYYSAHQLILSLTKRKAKGGKVNEAIDFVNKSVVRLCAAQQYASASDAAVSIFEYAGKENFSQMQEIFTLLLASPESQYWRSFLTQLDKNDILSSTGSKESILDCLYASKISGNSDKLSSTATLTVKLSSSSRFAYLEKYAAVLASETSSQDVLDLHMYFLAELSLALLRETQFADCNVLLRSFSQAVNGDATATEGEFIKATSISSMRIFNFCVLVFHLCQRKAPTKNLFTSLLNEYLPESLCKSRLDLNRIRSFVEGSLLPVFIPSALPRYGPGKNGPPPDLMNMLQGLLGPQTRR